MFLSLGFGFFFISLDYFFQCYSFPRSRQPAFSPASMSASSVCFSFFLFPFSFLLFHFSFSFFIFIFIFCFLLFAFCFLLLAFYFYFFSFFSLIDLSAVACRALTTAAIEAPTPLFRVLRMSNLSSRFYLGG